MQRNTAGKWVVFAYEDEGGTNPGERVTGDAANITANMRIDGGAANAIDDTNPTELEDGYYVFDVTAVEANGDLLLLTPQSSTANVNVVGVPAAVWTRPNTTSAFRTTIATLASQTSFTLTAGPADDDALNGWVALVRDATTNLQMALGVISDYTGSTKTITLQSDPGIFTMAATDSIELFPSFSTSGLSDQAKADIRDIAGVTLASGTIGATGNDTTHLHLTGLAYADDGLNDYLIIINDNSTGLYHAEWISDWVNSTALATVGTLPFTPEASTDTYWVMAVRQDVTGGSGLDPAGVRSAVGLASANLDTQLGALPTAAENRAEIDSNSTQLAAIVADTNELQTDDIPGLIAALNDLSASDILTTQMTEAYAANGVAPTLAQALFAIHQTLMHFGISGTSKTVKQLDNTTTAFVETLDDGTDPTAVSRT